VYTVDRKTSERSCSSALRSRLYIFDPPINIKDIEKLR
jgi:hypothetical protein